MTDVAIRNTANGGEIQYVNGQALTDEGVESAVFLSLYGGNEEDSGSDGDKPIEWWGNKTEPDPTKHYRSETQNLLRTLPVVPSSLKRIEDAVQRDLAWMTAGGFATFVTVLARIPALNTFRIDIVIEIDGKKLPVGPFTEKQAQSQ